MLHCRGWRQVEWSHWEGPGIQGCGPLFVVSGGEGPFKVKIAQDYVLFACVGVFHTEVEVGAGPVRPKAFLLWAKDFSGLYIVRR